MTPRRASWLAWALFGCFVALTVAALLAGGGGDEVLFVLPTSGFAFVGALVASRRPGNAVGWLLLVIALTFGLQSLVASYLRVGGRPGELALAWVDAWLWYVWIVLAGMVLPLVFPTGRLLSRRWRWVLGLVLVALAVSVVGAAFEPGPLDAATSRPVRNPLGAGGPWRGVVAWLALVGDLLAALAFGLAILALVLRLRRSRGEERRQVMLFVYVVGLASLGLVVATAAEVAGQDSGRWVYYVGAAGWLSAVFLIIVGIPLAIGVGVFRHRLFDIDVVINRTLVYGSLTATLALSYLGMVLLFRFVLSPVTGESDLAVAASTLAVAALVRPVRSRIQRAVDQRFFRSRYDAAQTLQGFAGRLRDELDLETLGTDLRTVVRATMQPAHVSLWLREASR